MKAQVEYLAATSEQPSWSIGADGSRTRTGTFELFEIELINARKARSQFDLDLDGFTLQRLDTSLKQVPSNDAEFDIHHAEVTDYVQKLYPEASVHIIDSTVRSSTSTGSMRPPARHVHNDYTPRSVAAHYAKFEGRPYEDHKLVKQLNFWRAYSTEGVKQDPLALLAPSSIATEDLATCEINYPTRVGEIMEVRYSSAHAWYWYPEMVTNEVLIFTGFSSSAERNYGMVPHASPIIASSGSDLPPRESVETRVLIIQ